MPAQDKPYRVYRGGRVKGRVPLTREPPPGSKTPPGTPSGPTAPGRRRWGRWVAVGLLVLVLLLVVWSVASCRRTPAGTRSFASETPLETAR